MSPSTKPTRRPLLDLRMRLSRRPRLGDPAPGSPPAADPNDRRTKEWRTGQERRADADRRDALSTHPAPPRPRMKPEVKVVLISTIVIFATLAVLFEIQIGWRRPAAGGQVPHPVPKVLR